MDWTYVDTTGNRVSCLTDVVDNAGKTVGKVATLNCIPAVFSNLINVALALAGTAAVIMIIWGGIRFIRSGGDAKQAQGARQTITWALVGLILILLSFAILNLISTFTGVGCIKEFGFTNCSATTPTP